MSLIFLTFYGKFDLIVFMSYDIEGKKQMPKYGQTNLLYLSSLK